MSKTSNKAKKRKKDKDNTTSKKIDTFPSMRKIK